MPVADWGSVIIGRLTLREGFTLTSSLNGTTGDRSLSLSGEESSPPLTLAEVKRRQEDILGLQDKFLPFVFTNKNDHNAWYQITDVDTSVTNWTGEVVKFSWTVSAVRVGAENGVDVESRLTGVARQNPFSLTGERWHAPSAGAYAYFTGTSQPSGSQTRALADAEGTVTVYRGVPASVSPRWGVALADYNKGRARVLVDAVERVATNITMGASAWELNNGLVKVSPGGAATLSVAAWDGSAWDSINWNASITASAAGPITSWSAATVLRNDHELVTVRLVGDTAPGRVSLDLTLRRGSRFVETYLQTDVAGTKSWYRASAEAGTAPASGAYISATANDAAGNRYLVAAANSFTAQTVQGGITKATTRTLDAGIGAVVGGGSAAAGDVATVLRDQYIRAMAEQTMGVRR